VGVNTFLDSVGRNSSSTKATYKIALQHFAHFLASYKKGYNPETVIVALQRQKVNVYELLDSFVSYLHKDISSPKSIKAYVTATKSYLQYSDIDIISHKFKHRVKLPKEYREDEQPIDAKDIRNLVQKCTNRRLKAFLLVLASSGLRAGEACSLRYQDVDFTAFPTKVHIRKEFNKTKTARDVYISDEATVELKDMIQLKRNKNPNITPNKLIFEGYDVDVSPKSCYNRLSSAFRNLLKVAKMGNKKDNSGRHNITLHSFRRAVFSIVTDQVNSEYANWLIGHSYSTYWTKKEPERRTIYTEHCMKYLTYLDYTTLEATGKNIEAKLREKDREMQAMKDKYELELETIRDETNQKFNQIMSMIQQNPKLSQVKPDVLQKKI
jgi:integrase